MSPAIGQTVETVRIGEHILSLFCQGGELGQNLLLPSDTDSKHLLGFPMGWSKTQGGKAKGNLVGILDLTDSQMLCQPKERFEWIGAQGWADENYVARAASISSHFCSGLLFDERIFFLA